jgi:hypothetical protein
MRATRYEHAGIQVAVPTVMSPNPDRVYASRQVAPGVRLHLSTAERKERQEALRLSESQWYRYVIDLSIRGIP